LKIFERPIRQGNKECAFEKYHILLVLRWPVGGIRTFIRYEYGNFDRSKYTILAPDMPELQVLLNDLQEFDWSYIRIEQRPSILHFVRSVFDASLRGHYDLIHSQGVTAGICSVLGSVVSNTPHIMTSHDVFLKGQFKGLKGLLKKLGLSFLIPMINIIHSVSYDAQDNLMQYLRVLGVFKKN